MYDKRDIFNILSAIVKTGILKRGEFWVSNKTALVMYGIKDKVQYVTLNCRKQTFNRIVKTTEYIPIVSNKVRMIYLNPDVILYEDNRSFTSTEIKHGFKIESINSIMSKKLFYLGNDGSNNKDIQEIKDYLNKMDNS